MIMATRSTLGRAALRLGRLVGPLSCTVALLQAACSSDDGSVLGGHGGAGAATGMGASAANGSGGDVGIGGSGAGTPTGGNGFCNTAMNGAIRDFQASHPDMEYVIEVDPGIVEPDLGADRKPVYAHGAEGTVTTHGPDTFNQWYNDVDGVNVNIPLTISLDDVGGGVYSYDNSEFFPIDGQGWGNEGNPHNYHFTYELHAAFVYQGGEVFTFTGDDDLFTFVNDKLAIDLGGVHGSMSDTIDLDARAAELGIEVGQTYPLDFFFAERHTTESHFRIDTTISFIDCGPPPPA
jgi:fibro-slime domain-containing protein